MCRQSHTVKELQTYKFAAQLPNLELCADGQMVPYSERAADVYVCRSVAKLRALCRWSHTEKELQTYKFAAQLPNLDLCADGPIQRKSCRRISCRSVAKLRALCRWSHTEKELQTYKFAAQLPNLDLCADGPIQRKSCRRISLPLSCLRALSVACRRICLPLSCQT